MAKANRVVHSRWVRNLLATTALGVCGLAACDDAGSYPRADLRPSATATNKPAAQQQQAASTPRPSATTPVSASNSAPPAPTDSSTPPMRPPVASKELKAVAASNNAFGVDLFKAVASPSKNVALSPASLGTAFAMTFAGARGTTATEMQKTLHLQGSAEDVSKNAGKLATELTDGSRQATLKIANRLFGEKTYDLEKPFLESTKTAFKAELAPMDFKAHGEDARREINGWVEQQTEKRIHDLLPAGSVDPDTRLVLVNAMYLMAQWNHPFTEGLTADAPFHVTGSKSKNVKMMHEMADYPVMEGDGVKVVEMRYRGDALSMFVVLPDEKSSLEALEKSLTAEKLASWTEGMKGKMVKLSLPRFTIDPSESFALKETLQKLGMKSAFSNKADFTGIAKPKSKADELKLAQVFHKVFVRVDEKGTEAAAATAVEMAVKGMAASPVEINFDRPFLFFVRDNASGLVLFMGHVADPSEK